MTRCPASRPATTCAPAPALAVRGRWSRRDLLVVGARAGAAALGAMAAAAASGIRTSPAVAQSIGPTRVALMTTRAAGDMGAVDDMVAFLALAKAEFGLQTSVVAETDPTKHEATVRRLAQNGNAIVAVTWDAVDVVLATVAPAFPSVRFIGIDGGPLDPAPPNVATVVFDSYLGAFLAGILCGHATLTRQLGFVGGVAAPRRHADANAFAAAARSVDETITGRAVFAGSFEDAGMGRDAAASLVAAGADVLLAAAGATDLGVAQVAQETGTFLVGGSEAIIDLAPASVIATVAVLHGQALHDQIRAALEPDWVPGHLRSGIADGMVELLVSDRFLAQGPAEMAERVMAATPLVDDARAAIIAGTLRPRFDALPPS